MSYFLVLLSETTDIPEAHPASHERFIDSLIERNAVLLGGPLQRRVNGFSGAYVLAAQDGDAATALAHADPLVTHCSATCQVTEWRLVGINTAAIDPTHILRS